MERLTPEAREALDAARRVAARLENTEVDGEHLLLALVEEPGRSGARLVAELGADPDPLRVQLEEELALRPRVPGADAEPDERLFTTRLRRLVAAAGREADELGDDLVDEEHLLAALIGEDGRTPGGLRLAEHGVTRDAFRAALGRRRNAGPDAADGSATTDAADRSATTDAW
ncbi:ATP-dependent Clp protease ATP-binding subunit ClpB [Micromonospora pattaloongensis]|uniref:ATP-dependent Clp protease ATP-binding subunit ClpB n=1 Tax=Micromonospora pattaloongensis TaxID=405436 RepID=A0A1H3RSQ3_9ACTN|nr:Clp protease N-terminal domain-containing protein [Micromonospora pattaloongensis]SDZ28375.1 ATP-dependent Clp protease ATP-binding subunit ClpB [Micromonospora pattaloongensis]